MEGLSRHPPGEHDPATTGTVLPPTPTLTFRRTKQGKPIVYRGKIRCDKLNVLLGHGEGGVPEQSLQSDGIATRRDVVCGERMSERVEGNFLPADSTSLCHHHESSNALR